MATGPLGRMVTAICVGVDQPGLLPPLTAAAQGARQFHDWLLQQREFGVQVKSTLLTDEKAGSVVRRADILKAVRQALGEPGDVLFLYLAGHGIAHSAYEEKLLLSEVRDDDTEAINLHIVKERGKRCSYPHVIVVYDACRTFATTETLRGVTAGPIFPLEGSRQGGGHVDVFHACSADESSFEVPESNGAHPSRYKAFFTDLLLEALKRPPPHIVEICEVGGRRVPVISSARLELLLETEVPTRAAVATPSFEQQPDIEVLSHMPREYFGLAPSAPDRPTDLSLDDRLDLASATVLRGPAPSPAAVVRQHTRRAFRRSHPPFKGRSEPDAIDKLTSSPAFDAAAEAVRRTRGRPKFETSCGFTVIGAGVARVEVSNNPQAEYLPQDSNPGESHFRIGRHDQPARGGSALIEFQTGEGVVLPILPGYVGAVLVEGGHVRALTFALSANTREFDIYQARAHEVDERRAVATAAASVGQLEQLARGLGNALADFIRIDKSMDPCLGVLAAHAYHLADNHDQVRSVWRWMLQASVRRKQDSMPEAVPVPFDVAMLAGELTPERALLRPGIAPLCPWLSLGWAHLPLSGLELHPAIEKAGRHRLPGTWTAFSPAGVGLLREAMIAGEIL